MCSFPHDCIWLYVYVPVYTVAHKTGHKVGSFIKGNNEKYCENREDRRGQLFCVYVYSTEVCVYSSVFRSTSGRGSFQ